MQSLCALLRSFWERLNLFPARQRWLQGMQLKEARSSPWDCYRLGPAASFTNTLPSASGPRLKNQSKRFFPSAENNTLLCGGFVCAPDTNNCSNIYKLWCDEKEVLQKIKKDTGSTVLTHSVLETGAGCIRSTSPALTFLKNSKIQEHWKNCTVDTQNLTM